MDIICIVTSIIYAFDTHGKHSNSQAHHLSYDAIIRNHEHYCNMEFIKENNIYKSILKLVLLFQTLQLIAQKSIASIYGKPKKYLLIKSIRNESPWQHVHTIQPIWASPSKKHKQLTKRQLETHTKESSLWEWTKGCPINFLPPSTWREQCPRAVISAEVKRMKRLHDLP